MTAGYGTPTRGTQLAYQRLAMRHLFAIVSLGVLGFGARDVYLHFKNKKKSPSGERKLEVWEGEGGAVPVARDRTAGQIPPR